jgi:uncharacterized tellurite resistance protein B-like protein
MSGVRAMLYRQGQITLATLHDLALLYLGLAHGTDGDLDPMETLEIAAKLRQWQPDKDPKLIDHIIREATLSYLNGASVDRLQEAVETLRQTLPEQVRKEILKDLSDIARADGSVIVEESQFIRQLAESWGLSVDRHDEKI